MLDHHRGQSSQRRYQAETSHHQQNLARSVTLPQQAMMQVAAIGGVDALPRQLASDDGGNHVEERDRQDGNRNDERRRLGSRSSALDRQGTHDQTDQHASRITEKRASRRKIVA